MSFKGGYDLGQLSLSVSPCCLFVRRQCCRKLEAAKSKNFFKLCHATLIAMHITGNKTRKKLFVASTSV
jgi:hypothetical protein